MPRNHVRNDSVSFCVVCCEEIEFFAIGQCDHPICYVCSVRMRVLGKEKYCAVCRTDLDKVLFTKHYGKWTTLQEQVKHGRTDKDSGICYANKEVHTKVNELLQHKCSICPDHSPERTINKLRDHMKREHNLYICNICLKHLQKFSHEWKFYSRADLARHRRVGDSEDTAYKGHPLCEFCDERFLDDDELHRHLRKNHFWCHICEKDGRQFYYQDYVNLRQHFREDHYLCEEDMCKYEQYTSVFRSEIDLQAHTASKHKQTMTKAQVRQARQLEVDLVFNNPPTTKGRNITGQDYNEVRASDQKFRRNVGKGRGNGFSNRQEEQNRQATTEKANGKTDEICTPVQQNKIKENPSNEGEKHKLPDDIPLLNGAAAAVSDAKITQRNSPKTSPKSTQKPEGAYEKPRNINSHDDFPSLGKPKLQQNGTTTDTKKTQNNSQRVSPKSSRKPETVFKKTRDIQSLEDFPTLVKPTNTQQKRPPPGFANIVKESKVSQIKPPPGLEVQPTFPVQPSTPDNCEISERKQDIILPKEEPKVTTNIEKNDEKSDAINNQLRNQNLIENIKTLVGFNNEKFVEFKTLSGKFRQGLCTAEAYYVACTVLFETNFGVIFNELVTLLPDQDKQKELLQVHNDRKALAKQSGKPLPQSTRKRSPQSTAWGPLQTNSAKPAPVKREGWQKSRNDVDFPSLPAAAPRQMKAAQYYKPTPNIALKSAWVRGK